MAATDDGYWRVGELADATGVTVRALHHYDRLGLLVPTQRTAAGHRLYASDDVRRLYRIVALRELGLPLDAIGVVLDHAGGGLIDTVRGHLDRVQRDLERQEQLRDRLTAILEALERSSEPSVDQFFSALEAMSMSIDVVEIARILGISRQTATALVADTPDFPAPESRRAGRPVWTRARVEAWAATHPERGPAWRRPSSAPGSTAAAAAPLSTINRLVFTQAQALDHGRVRDEHLLLALLHLDCPGVAREVLEEAGLTAEAVRRRTVERVGDPDPTAAGGGVSLSGRPMSVLERAQLRAVALRDEQVSGEHLLLALLDVADDSPVRELLAAERVDPAAVAQRVLALTDRRPPGDPTTFVEPLADAVHAADVARTLGVSRRRVVELAACAPDFPASRWTESGYRMWSRPAVEAWAAAHPDRGPHEDRLRPPPPGTMGAGTERVFAIAHDLATDLNHGVVGTHHLFLALLHPECPGAAGAVLASLGFVLDEARERFVEAQGDRYEAHGRELVIPPATRTVLERATLSALELEDEEATGVHVLLALANDPHRSPFPDTRALHERLMTATDGMLPVAEPVAPKPRGKATRIPRPPELELAPSPAGHDPRRRRPWGSGVFAVPGKSGSPANGQYFIDRDGFPVSTRDGAPVHILTDDHGMVLDKEGHGILTEVPVPEGSQVRAYPRDG